jgi:hypothetical protein
MPNYRKLFIRNLAYFIWLRDSKNR